MDNILSQYLKINVNNFKILYGLEKSYIIYNNERIICYHYSYQDFGFKYNNFGYSYRAQQNTPIYILYGIKNILKKINFYKNKIYYNIIYLSNNIQYKKIKYKFMYNIIKYYYRFNKILNFKIIKKYNIFNISKYYLLKPNNIKLICIKKEYRGIYKYIKYYYKNYNIYIHSYYNYNHKLIRISNIKLLNY